MGWTLWLGGGFLLFATTLWWRGRQQRRQAAGPHVKEASFPAATAAVPLPGTVSVRTFGTPGPAPREHVKVVVWNIERGFRLPAIIRELQQEDADVVLLQEVDSGCKRTACADVGAEIAAALSMTCIYANEMDGVNMALKDRVKRTAESEPGHGSEGNAILTRLEVITAKPLPLPCVRNRYKPHHAHIKTHTQVAATLKTPSGPVTFVSVHLDAFAGRVKRSQQFQAMISELAWCKTPLVIGGDLNTTNHGIVRCMNAMAGEDPFRWSAWGISEATWWLSHVLPKPASLHMQRLLQDPFDCEKDITAGVPGIYTGKLDWLLCTPEVRCRAATVQHTCASDHHRLTANLYIDPATTTDAAT